MSPEVKLFKLIPKQSYGYCWKGLYLSMNNMELVKQNLFIFSTPQLGEQSKSGLLRGFSQEKLTDLIYPQSDPFSGSSVPLEPPPFIGGSLLSHYLIPAIYLS